MSNINFNDIKEKIRSEVDILAIASEYLQIKKTGANYKALCPFHTEKSPSFVLNVEKQVFHCFGCGAGGDIFEFVGKMENISFFETMERLGQKCGIDVRAQTQTGFDSKSKNSAFDVNQKAGIFFQKMLLSSPAGKQARAYLQERGLQEETISKFMIGFAGQPRTGLSKHLTTMGFSTDLQEKYGLVRKSDSGEYFSDRFRNRVIFPIFEVNGKIAGFGGRVLQKEEKRPKYLNSPETIVYKKGNLLYGLNFAKESIKKNQEAILVEGYMDLIHLHKSGFENVVATSGTALTDTQIRLLGRYTDTVVVMFDGDNAGIKAAIKGCALLVEKEMKVKVLELPKGMDPEDFLKEKGVEAFTQFKNDALPFMDYMIEKAIGYYDISAIEGKVACVAKLMPYMLKLSSSIERGFYISKIATRLNISEKSIYDEIKGMRRKEVPTKQSPDTLAIDIKVESHAEQALIQLLLKDLNLIDKVTRELHGNDFQDKDLAQIVDSMHLLKSEDHLSVPNLLSTLKSERAKQMVTKYSTSEIAYSEIDDYLADCIRDIKRKEQQLPAFWKTKDSPIDRQQLIKEQYNRLKGHKETNKFLH